MLPKKKRLQKGFNDIVQREFFIETKSDEIEYFSINRSFSYEMFLSKKFHDDDALCQS